MEYNPTSKILFLFPCSRHKKEGGFEQYDNKSAISSILNVELTKKFLNKREEIFKCILNTKGMYDQGMLISDEGAGNDHLTHGNDLGGDKKAHYFPAVERYNGRLYKEFGTERNGLISSSHHILILSGLYGLLRLEEPIQNYNCFIDQRIIDYWEKDTLLTNVLLKYIFKYGILLVFDLTGMDMYRKLIDWDSLRQHQIRFFHCHCKTGAGADALMDFAELLKDKLLLKSEEDLLAINPETSIGTILFSKANIPPEGKGFPREDKISGNIPPPCSNNSNESEKKMPTTPTTLPAKEKWIVKYGLHWSKSVQSYEHFAREIANAIHEIEIEPMTPHGDTIKALTKDLKGKWRYRIHDDYRLVYEPKPNKKEVILIEIAHRKEIYE